MATFLNPYIQYVSKIIPQNAIAPDTISQMTDCVLLNNLLSKIPEFAPPKIQEEPTTFAHIFSNLKQTYKRVEAFWNEVLDKELECGQIDLIEIAHNYNEKEMTKIIDIVLQALVLSSQKQFFISKMLETSQGTQQYFMNIVQRTIRQRKTFSPRKRKQQRMNDKLVELQNQNYSLQNLISQICQQKFQIEIKYKQLVQQLSQKDLEVLKLGNFNTPVFETPQRTRDMILYDSVEKNAEYIQQLRLKMIKMSKQHQKQLFDLNEKLQCYTHKIKKLQEVQNQLQLYKMKIESSQDIIKQFQELTRQCAKLKVSQIEKNQHLSEYTRKLNSKTNKIRELEQLLMEKEITIQKLNFKVEQQTKSSFNNTFDDSFNKITSIPLQRSLSQHSVDSLTSQLEVFHQKNNSLREELQKIQQANKKKDEEIAKLLKVRNLLDSENRRLRDLIERNIDKFSQQKNILLGGFKLCTRDRGLRRRVRQSVDTLNNIHTIKKSNKENLNNSNQLNSEDDSSFMISSVNCSSQKTPKFSPNESIQENLMQ